MTRRSFLATLAAAFVAPDADELLWRRGARLISVPAPRVKIGDTITIRVPPRFVGRTGYDLRLPPLVEYRFTIDAFLIPNGPAATARAYAVPLPHAPPPQLLERRRA